MRRPIAREAEATAPSCDAPEIRGGVRTVLLQHMSAAVTVATRRCGHEQGIAKFTVVCRVSPPPPPLPQPVGDASRELTPCWVRLRGLLLQKGLVLHGRRVRVYSHLV